MIVAAPTIGKDFGADVSTLSWLTAAFFLAAAACLLPFGRVADIKGAQRVFTLGIAIYLVSNLLCAIAPNMLVLIAGRALTGVGAGMVFGTSIALLGLVFPSAERGKAIGLNVTAMFIGFILGNLAGGFLTFYLSWRVLFVLAAGVAGLDLALISLRVRQECELSLKHDYDPIGMLAYAGAIFLLFYGLSQIGHLTGLAWFAAGALLLLGFVLWERRYPNPLIPKGISKSRDFAWAAGSNLTFQGGTFAIPFLLSLQFQYVSDLDSRIAGILLIIPQAVMIVLGPIGGRLSDKVLPRRVAGLGCLISLVGTLILVFVSEGTPLSMLIVVLLLGGIGTALFMPAVLNWTLRGVPRETYNIASSMTETSRMAGMTLSNAVVIVVFGLIMGTATVGPDNLPQFISSMNATAVIFLLMAGLCAAMAFGVFDSLMRSRKVGR